MYISSAVAERIKERAKEKNVTVKRILTEVGLGVNTMSNMKTSMPSADSLARIADYLDCSVDYLLGRTVSGETLSEEERELIKALRSHPEMKQAVMKLLE